MLVPVLATSFIETQALGRRHWTKVLVNAILEWIPALPNYVNFEIIRSGWARQPATRCGFCNQVHSRALLAMNTTDEPADDCARSRYSHYDGI